MKQSVLKEMDDRMEPDFKDTVMDMLHSVAYQNTPLAKAPIGTSTTVENLTKEQLSHFADNSLKVRVHFIYFFLINCNDNFLIRELALSLLELVTLITRNFANSFKPTWATLLTTTKLRCPWTDPANIQVHLSLHYKF